MSYANAWTIVNNNYKRKGKSFTVSDKIDIIAKKKFFLCWNTLTWHYR